jgi:hypothetical protein
MALTILAVDDVTGKRKRTGVATSALQSFSDNTFNVTAGGGQTAFTVSSGTVGASNTLDVYWNGNLLDEGDHYTRNAGLNKVDTTFTIPNGGRIRVRVWVK